MLRGTDLWPAYFFRRLSSFPPMCLDNTFASCLLCSDASSVHWSQLPLPSGMYLFLPGVQLHQITMAAERIQEHAKNTITHYVRVICAAKPICRGSQSKPSWMLHSAHRCLFASCTRSYTRPLFGTLGQQCAIIVPVRFGSFQGEWKHTIAQTQNIVG